MKHAYATIRDYESAAEYLGSKQDRPIARNTRIILEDDKVISIRLHATSIVRYYPEGMVEGGPVTVLYSGGYRTSTTKSRINEFCPEGFYVWQERGNWFLHKHEGGTYPFAEGITIVDGTVYNAGTESDIEMNHKRTKQIKKYVAEYVAALIAGKVPAPSAGDCFYCGMVTVDGNEPLGEATHNTDHLELHLEESYYVPSLLMNAIKKYNISSFAKGVIGNIWRGDVSPSKWEIDITTRDVKSSLTRYLKSQFSIAR